MPVSPSLLKRALVFVSGKGGVGKTAVSQALAQLHTQNGRKTLWVQFDDPTTPSGSTSKSPLLDALNCTARSAFEEFIGLKLGSATLAKFFIQNKLIQFLAEASPGLPELVQLGKVWYEIRNYERVVVDMPSTGYGLAMFQSATNFAALFGTGPLAHDARKILATLEDPTQCGSLILALPEEMPLQEASDLDAELLKRFPKNRAQILVNRRISLARTASNTASPMIARNTQEFLECRDALERAHLERWSQTAGTSFETLPWLPPHALQTPLSHALEVALQKDS